MKVTLLTYTPEPEKIVASAAKLCYSSSDIETLMDGLTDDKIDSFLTRLETLGHCYDEETEVLSKNGFIKWSLVNENTELAAISPENRTFIGFEKPSKLFNYDYEGEMVKIVHNDIDLLVTNGHKLYASPSKSAYLRTHPQYSLLPTNYILNTGKMLFESPFRLVLSAKNSNAEITKEDSVYKLYGFFIGDGYADKKIKNGSIKFHIRKKRKVEYLKKICNEIGVELKEEKNDKYTIKTEEFCSQNFRKMFYNSNGEKTFPLEFLTMSSNQFDYFIEGLINSDGHYAGLKKNIEYSTTSYELIDRLQALCSINNTNCSYTINTNEENENQKRCYRVYIYTQRSLYPMINDSRTKDRSNATVEYYNGKVYCASISTGLLVVRRNGKVCLCGNCSPFEHVSFTFGIEDVSRSFLAQITRHRIGCSFSVQSQRYVRLDGDKKSMIIPEAIKNNPDAMQVFNETTATASNGYEHLCKILEDEHYKKLITNGGIDEKTARRKASKMANEEARSVLPNACSTRMIVTMNARELNHFFNMRCCTRAQDEIREVANEMLRLVYPIAPHLFKNAGPGCVSGACPEGAMSCGKVNEMRDFYKNLKENRD